MVYLLWLQNSGICICIIVSRYAVGSVTVYTIWRLFVFRYTCKSRHFDSRGAAPTTPLFHWLSGKVVWWGLHLKSQNDEACIHVDTGFLLVMLCIRPFAKTSENKNRVESKGILKISRLDSNYFYKVSKKLRIKCTTKGGPKVLIGVIIVCFWQILNFHRKFVYVCILIHVLKIQNFWWD